MTPQEFEQAMLELEKKHLAGRKDIRDPESWHAEVDDLKDKLLRELGYGAGVDVWERHGGWYA